MIDRRMLMASGLAFGATNALAMKPSSAAKRAAIEAIQLPPSFNGSFAYARGGKIEHARYVGMADVEAGKAILPDTQFKWGSASKWLTSVTVLRFVEQKRLSLDAPVTAYLPEFRHDTGEQVLLKHVLSNTSGIPDLLSRQLGKEPALRTSTASAAAILSRFGGGDLSFVPGKGWDYAAINWVIVAAILERLTGKSFPEVVARQTLRPLGMSATGFAQSGQPPMPKLAAAYGSASPPVRKMDPIPPFVAASGNAAGTVRDAVRAAHGIFHGSLLSAASRRELTTIRWPEQEYALGGRVHPIDGTLWAWETGKVQGYRAHIAHRLDQSETIVIFNTTDLAQSQLGTWVEAIARA
ncbi:serine hydrolase domain-containing protein [Sphingomonas sp. Leaf30]|uniref:serine hydrolase domain-containing protein n=1 Tax=Sphingomonas sp. Leaf30 TaxID=1736213 RepID=UPI0009E8B813|nr:serine hydrolase domain-containing protein [Sphingomonas sp. Leaf30]